METLCITLVTVSVCVSLCLAAHCRSFPHTYSSSVEIVVFLHGRERTIMSACFKSNLHDTNNVNRDSLPQVKQYSMPLTDILLLLCSVSWSISSNSAYIHTCTILYILHKTPRTKTASLSHSMCDKFSISIQLLHSTVAKLQWKTEKSWLEHNEYRGSRTQCHNMKAMIIQRMLLCSPH